MVVSMARLIGALFREQPRAFHMIFMLEIWERFGFYTGQGILVIYFVRVFGFSDENAYCTFGAFSALIYGMVALGGYLGDRVLGTKRTILLGLIVLALGYFWLALADKAHIFYALSAICVGNALFKANPSSLLAKCYSKGDKRLHGGFTLYYMAINLGALAALLIGPLMSSHYGYPAAFFVSFIGIMLGILNYYLQRHHIAHIPSPLDALPVGRWKMVMIFFGILGAIILSNQLLQQVYIAKKIVWVVSLLVTGIYFGCVFREEKARALRMVVAFILMLEAVAFFVLYQQMPTSLNLFAVNNVHAVLFGLPLNPQSFQALNPIWIICLSPLLAYFYGFLNKRGVSFQMPYKFALGMGCCGFSFIVIYFARFFHDDLGMVSSNWLVVSYLFQSLGELLVSALGVAMVAELVPHTISGFVMGMWFLTSSVAGFLGATVASFTALPTDVSPGLESLMIYTKVFAWIGIITLVLAFFLWVIAPQLCRLINSENAVES